MNLVSGLGCISNSDPPNDGNSQGSVKVEELQKEKKAKEAEKRIASLENIEKRNGELVRIREDLLTFHYLELRGRAGEQEVFVEKYKHSSILHK